MVMLVHILYSDMEGAWLMRDIVTYMKDPNLILGLQIITNHLITISQSRIK